jgi:hypothetical protein
MKSTELFPDEKERKEVKVMLDFWNGTLTEVRNSEGNIIYQNNSFDQNRGRYGSIY